MVVGIDGKKRCFGGDLGKELLGDYHDNSWGVPIHNDHHLFEMLILEGAQAGLNWETVLKKQQGYRKAFYNFDPKKVARMSDAELESLRQNNEIIRNRLKINSVRQNAKVFLNVQQEFGSFDKYVWGYVDNKPIIHQRKHLEEIPTTSIIGDAISKDLKKRGMTFVGPTIIYAYIQAIGMVNDHLVGCWRYNK
jgi:DNA-3-methyladenine glycosylase I